MIAPAIPWVTNTEPLSQAWHEYRAARITSTDVAAILGYYSTDPEQRAHLCRFRTAYQVWGKLKGYTESETGGGETSDQRRGRFGEEVAIATWEGDTGKRVTRTAGILQHPEYPWLCATVDGIVVSERRGVEVKCPRFSTYAEWLNGTPLRYRIQGTVAAMCGDLDGTYFVVGLDDVASEFLPRDPGLEGKIFAACQRFREDFIDGDGEPEPYDFEADAPVMSEILKRGNTNACALTNTAQEALAKWREAREVRLRAEKIEKATKLVVANELSKRRCDVGVMPDGSGVTWKMDARGYRKLAPVKRVKREDVLRVKQ